MEVTFLQAEDFPEWDRFVDESPQGDVFCYAWWLETVTKGDFKILAARDGRGIVAGMPLPFHSTGRINEPFLTRTLGVLYRDSTLLPPRNRLSRERKCLVALLDHVPLDQFVQFCMSHNVTDWLPFRWRGFRQTTRYTYLIDYAGTTPDSLWNNVASTCRAIIRNAVRNGIVIEESDDIELVHRYSRLTFQRQGLTFRYPLQDLALLDDAIQSHGCRRIFKAVDPRGRIHAVFYAVFRPQSAYCLLSGGDPELRNLGGHTLLFWHVVTYFRERVSLLNFGGSDLENIEAHIRHFGGTPTPYFHIFNEDLMNEGGGIRFHGKRIIFHSKGLFHALRRRVFS